MMNWINGDPSVFIILKDLHGILDRGSRLPFPNGILINEHLSTWNKV